MTKYRALVYATDVRYTGNFIDNDEVDLLSLGREQGDEELVESHIISPKEVRKYEDMREVVDLGRGVCTVYWCEIEKVESEDDD